MLFAYQKQGLSQRKKEFNPCLKDQSVYNELLQ